MVHVPSWCNIPSLCWLECTGRNPRVSCMGASLLMGFAGGRFTWQHDIARSKCTPGLLYVYIWHCSQCTDHCRILCNLRDATSCKQLSDFRQRPCCSSWRHCFAVRALAEPSWMSLRLFRYHTSFSHPQYPLLNSHAGWFHCSCLGHQDTDAALLLPIPERFVRNRQMRDKLMVKCAHWESCHQRVRGTRHRLCPLPVWLDCHPRT